MFYWSPRRAASETLDESRLIPSILLAVAVVAAIQAPVFIRRQALTAELPAAASRSAEQEDQSSKSDALQDAAAAARASRIPAELETVRGSSQFRDLAVVAGLFVPAAIAIVVLLQGLGRCSNVVGREYGAVLLCIVTSWTAARLLLVPIAWARIRDPAIGSKWSIDWTLCASDAVFLAMAAVCLRVCLGSKWMPASVAASAGGGLLVASGYVTAALSPMLWMLSSPCLLIYLWGRVGSGFNSIGVSLSSRQSLRRALEATTLNPRDADAHFQLGLIRLQRGDTGEAEARFRKAVEIDPSDADYAYKLGCVLRDRGQPAEALEWLSRAAKLNEKAAGYEAWREIGAIQSGLGSYAESLIALERYLNCREYDPVGLVYHAEALSHLGRQVEAQTSYKRALESIATMPNHRRREFRPWARRATNGLSSISRNAGA